MAVVKKFIGTKAALLAFLTNFFGASFGLILHVLLSRLLGVTGYGQYSLVFSIFVIYTFVFTPGLSLALVHFSSFASNPRNILLFCVRVEILVDIFLCIMYFTLAKVICSILSIPSLLPYVMLMGIMIMPSGLTTIMLSYLRGQMEFEKVFFISILNHSIRFILCISVLFLGFGITGIIASLTVTQLIVFILAVWTVRIRKMTKFHFHSEVLKMAIPIWGMGIAAYLMKRIDIFCIKYFLEDYSYVAYYASAFCIIELLILFLFVPSSAILPVLSLFLRNKKDFEAKQVLERYVRYTFLLAVPLCLWLFSNSKLIMSIVFSYKFVSGASVLSIFCIFWIFLSILHVLSTPMFSSRGSWILFKFNLLTVFANFCLNVLLIPRYGINGAAIATAFSTFCFLVAVLIYAYRKDILPAKKLIWIDKSTVYRIIMIIFILGIVNRFLVFPQTWMMLGVKSILMVICYLVLLFLFKEINSEDKVILKAVRDNFVDILQRLFNRS